MCFFLSELARLLKVASVTCVSGFILTLSADPVIPTSVLYSDDPGAPRYETLRGILGDVFGDDDPNAGAFTETEAQYNLVSGSGPQEVTFTFLYDGGGYLFEFGFFHITDELLAMPTDTVEQKQAWAVEALSTAEVVIVDKDAASVPSGAIRAQPAANNPYSNESWEYSAQPTTANTATRILEGGSRLGFFIIPDNTLSNFLYDSQDGHFSQFAINGSYSENDGKNWPLFSFTDANPGLQAGNTGNVGNPLAGDIGTNPDQVLTFDGTAQEGWFGPGSEATPGTLVSFEDLWRRPNPSNSSWWKSSDNDFEDLVFYIGNVHGTPVPEPGTVAAGVLLTLSVGLHLWRRRRSVNLKS